MKMIYRYLSVATLMLMSLVIAASAYAKPKVVATTTDVGALVRAVGGDMIDLDTITKGSQDPHYIEAKPSYMVKMSRADLVVANGLSLEVGWLPSLIQGARNPKIKPGNAGYLELGSHVTPLNRPQGQISRAQGDVHPEGNPHFTLDPVRLGDLASVVAAKLSELDAGNKPKYEANAAAFKQSLTEKLKGWRERVAKLPSKKLVSYHATLTYFLDRFDLQAVTVLEPKPGIPPSPQHALDVIATMKRENVKAILIDNFFEPRIGHRVAADVPGAKVEVVGVAVESKPELKTESDVIDQLISALERANSK